MDPSNPQKEDEKLDYYETPSGIPPEADKFSSAQQCTESPLGDGMGIISKGEEQIGESSQEDQRSLSTDALENSLAFKGISASMYHEAVNLIRDIPDTSPLYPPLAFPTWRNPAGEGTVSTRSHNGFPSRLSHAEGVAITVLLQESRALAHAHESMPSKLGEALHLPENGWVVDGFEGIGSFGTEIGLAAAGRQRLLHPNIDLPQWILEDLDISRQEYGQSIQEDGMEIGEHTVKTIVTHLEKENEHFIQNNPEGARNPQEIQERIDAKNTGVNLAAKLYLEVRKKAKGEVSGKLNDLENPASARTVGQKRLPQEK